MTDLLLRGVVTLRASADTQGKYTPTHHGWTALYLPRRIPSAYGTLDLEPAAYSRYAQPMYRLSDVLETVEANLSDPHGSNTAHDEHPDGSTAKTGEGISPSVWDALFTLFRLPEALTQDIITLETHIGSIDVVVSGEKSDLPGLPSEAQLYLCTLTESWANQDYVVVVPINQYPVEAVGRTLEPGDIERCPDLCSPVDVGESFQRRLEPGDGGTAKPRLMWYAKRPKDITAYNLSIWEQPADATEPVSNNPETQTSPETPDQSRNPDKAETQKGSKIRTVDHGAADEGGI